MGRRQKPTDAPTDASPAGGKFAPGQSGNPAGRPPGVPNKATVEIKKFCQELFERPAFQKALIAQWDALTLDPALMKRLIEYGYGPPPRIVDLGPRAAVSIARLLAGDFTEEDE